MVLAGGVAWFVCSHLTVTLTPSLTHRVFWRSTSPAGVRAVHTGSYIIFEHVVPAPLNRLVRVVKRVGCSSGETLTADANDDYYCNGQYLGRAKRRTLLGEPLTPFRYNGVVPDGMLFVVGDHRDSYDSRYIGFVQHEMVEEIAWALF